MTEAFLVANSGQLLLGTVFGGIALIMLLESIAPFRAVDAAPGARWVSNLLLAVFQFTLIFALTPLLAIAITGIFGFENQGVLHRLEVSGLSAFVVTLLAMEFVGYWIHRAFHRIPLLWRIHRVHHCDPEMDATTSHRHHPFEPVMTTLVTVPVLVALGPETWVVVLYSLLHAAIAVISHGNISFGTAIDPIARRIIVTPDFHRLHHAAEQRFTDSNYGNILPWFDYLFATASTMPVDQQQRMTLGLDEFQRPQSTRLSRLLFLPFVNRLSRAQQPAEPFR